MCTDKKLNTYRRQNSKRSTLGTNQCKKYARSVGSVGFSLRYLGTPQDTVHTRQPDLSSQAQFCSQSPHLLPSKRLQKNTGVHCGLTQYGAPACPRSSALKSISYVCGQWVAGSQPRSLWTSHPSEDQGAPVGLLGASKPSSRPLFCNTHTPTVQPLNSSLAWAHGRTGSRTPRLLSRCGVRCPLSKPIEH